MINLDLNIFKKKTVFLILLFISGHSVWADRCMVFGSQGIARDWFKKVQACFSGIKPKKIKRKSDLRSNLGLSEIKLPSERKRQEERLSPGDTDLALGLCENNYVVTAQIKYLSENTRTPTHSELIRNLERGCQDMNSRLFSSFVPDFPY